MLNFELILDRFGDEDFLRTLWLKTKRQLPQEIEGASKLVATRTSGVSLSKKVHKLRGLIANFLEGGQAIDNLRACEELAAQPGQIDRLTSSWSTFLHNLEAESGQLEAWLQNRGFPCL